MMEATKVAIYQGENGPIALVTGEIQPGQRRTIARIDGVGNSFNERERQQWADEIVRAVNTFEQAKAALKKCAEKLALYRDKSSGEYVGGMEHAALMKHVNEVLAAMEALQ